MRKLFAPRREFVEKTKGRFLAVFDAHYGIQDMRHASRGMAGWTKGLIVAGAFVAVMVSVSAYADTANVAADSPLYPLKRLSENVQLALTPASGQAKLEVTLAARRANEIQDLSVRKPSSTLITGLSVDFDNAVSSSLGHIESSGRKENSTSSTPHFGAHTMVCGQMNVMVSQSAQARMQIADDPALSERFQYQCGGDDGEHMNASSTEQGSAPGDGQGDNHSGRQSHAPAPFVQPRSTTTTPRGFDFSR